VRRAARDPEARALDPILLILLILLIVHGAVYKRVAYEVRRYVTDLASMDAREDGGH
jgi:hypothetical protein